MHAMWWNLIRNSRLIVLILLCFYESLTHCPSDVADFTVAGLEGIFQLNG